jgi:hypothetical protein
MSVFRERCILHLDSGMTVEGVLVRRGWWRQWWLLAEPRVEVGGALRGVAGPVAVPRRRVVWAQRVQGVGS